MKLLVASGNRGKIEEFRRILEPVGVAVVEPGELGLDLDVVEDGETFAANAWLKAEAYYRASGLPSVSDDSGLCVDALDGRPGVHSARYLGDAGYREKIAGLLDEMKDVPTGRRGAHFACAICCVLGEDERLECEGICRGEIGHAPAGSGGFGFDPVFFVGDKSFAELSGAEKDAMSHRGKALRELKRLLEDYTSKHGGIR